MNEREKFTPSQLFGEVERDNDEFLTPGEKRFLRKSRSSAFAQEVKKIIKNHPAEDSRKGDKKSMALPINMNGETIYARAAKQTEKQLTHGRIHYINVNYKLNITRGEDEYPLFTFTEVLYPEIDDPMSFSHGDMKISNMHGKLASHHEALEGLWAIGMLEEQLEARIE